MGGRAARTRCAIVHFVLWGQLIALPVLQNYQNRQEASNAAKADADHQALTYLATLQDEQLQILRKLDTMTIPHGRGVAAEAQGA